MAGGKTQYLARIVIDKFFDYVNAPYTRPGQLYIALFSTVPTAAGGTEFTSANAPGYSRRAISNNSTFWSFNPNVMFNTSTAIASNTASANWPTCYGVGLYDAATGGNLLYWGVLDTPIANTSGNWLQFAAGQFQVTEA